MSIFPTKILLATDGSREAELAATTAADLARSTGSELHVLYVGEAANPYVDVVERAGDEPVNPRLDTNSSASSSGKLARCSTPRQKGCGRPAGRWRKLTSAWARPITRSSPWPKRWGPGS